MKNYIKIIILILGVLFASCQANEDYYLDQTIFNEDPSNPRLPIYSEEGYNSFGAYIDRVPFVSTQSTPTKIIVKNDTTTFILNGIYGYNQEATLQFRFKCDFANWESEKHSDLMHFDNQKVNFKESNVEGTFFLQNDTIDLEIISGNIHFKKAKKMFVDEEAMETILSGVFEVKYLNGSNATTIKSGRFDFGYGFDNFYFLK